MKRFYKDFKSKFFDEKYYFYYDDDKPLKTPLNNLVITSYKKLADALMHEWNSQNEEIDIKSLRINYFMNTVHDVTQLKRVSIIENLQEYAQFDCLFHFTAEENEQLFKKQINLWLPIIQKFQTIYDIRLKFDTQLIVEKQSDEYLKLVNEFFNKRSDEELTVLYKIVTILGSVVLGNLVFYNHIPSDYALEVSRLEQDYNIGEWGLDLEAEKARENIDNDYKQAIHILDLLS